MTQMAKEAAAVIGRIVICLVLGATLLTGPAGAVKRTPAAAPEAPLDLTIPLGRVQIFGEQQQQAMADLNAEIEDDRRSPHSLYGKLFVAIWIHNVNVQRACEAKMVSRPVCRTGLSSAPPPPSRRSRIWRAIARWSREENVDFDPDY